MGGALKGPDSYPKARMQLLFGVMYCKPYGFVEVQPVLGFPPVAFVAVISGLECFENAETLSTM